VADQVVRDLPEVISGDDRVGKLVEWVGVDLPDGLDQVVEPNLAGHADWIRHTSRID
jgi:hypothetical protein